jgi:hypothetical protein
MPRTPQPEPDRDADPEAWERWVERQGRNERARERRAERRDRLTYPADGTPMVAEASCEGTFFRPPPLPPSVLRVSVRIQTPQESLPQDGSMTIGDGFLSDALPLPWKVRDFIWNWIKNGVHEGLYSAAHFLPRGGMDITITRLDVIPPLTRDASVEEIGRFREALMAAVQGAVVTAFGGLIAYNQRRRYIEPPPPAPAWQIGRRQKNGTIAFEDVEYASRAAGETALTQEQRAHGYEVFEVRDMWAQMEMERGALVTGEIRYGDLALTPEEASQVQPDEWIFHLPVKGLRRVRGVKRDAPGGPLINAGRGWEHYTFFRLPREGDRG